MLSAAFGAAAFGAGISGSTIGTTFSYDAIGNQSAGLGRSVT
ncbi:hypothetical protein [Bradyrhizobium sp. NAS96.2]|nr:hypothetical protein [Bradyrhizobium sp. NAS96.2]